MTLSDLHRNLGRNGSSSVEAVLVVALIALLSTAYALTTDNSDIDETHVETKSAAKPDSTKHHSSPEIITLFDGKTLDGWKVTNFGGEGEVIVKDGQIIMEMGVDLSGITWQKKNVLPRSNYEVSLDAMRINGGDFFCGLTFPVKDDPCSLIVGGWGGGVCGLSSIDGMDASENETTSYQTFESGRWYHIRLVVTDDKIEAWIDKKKIVDQKITGRKISIRSEVELSKPFGFSTWQTTAALRNIEIRKLEQATGK